MKMVCVKQLVLAASRRYNHPMSKNDTTSVRQQYLDLKAQYPDTILFFRLGDFYETFDEDAEIASQELDLILTSRPVSKDVRVPMAGVPHHAVDGYIARLIEKGFRVALAEQVGEPTGSGPMERRVERVVTAGTLTEPEMLDDKRPNYLAAVVVEGERAGIAYAEISTGEFATTQLSDGSTQNVLSLVRQELARLRPREVLIPKVGSWKERDPDDKVATSRDDPSGCGVGAGHPLARISLRGIRRAPGSDGPFSGSHPAGVRLRGQAAGSSGCRGGAELSGGDAAGAAPADHGPADLCHGPLYGH